jgi:hypothetical protein
MSWLRLGEKVLSDKVRALALDPSNPETIYVGTEPPALWKSEDGGNSWREIAGVNRLAKEKRWTYPVPVIQPHVRCIAIDPNNPKKLCLAAQVGGILLSEDEGESWRDVRYPIDLDVHSVTFGSDGGNLLYAATGGGENFPDPTPPPKGHRFTVRATAANLGNPSAMACRAPMRCPCACTRRIHRCFFSV